MNKQKRVSYQNDTRLFFYSTIFQYLAIVLFKLDINKLHGNYKVAVLLSTFSSFCVFIILFLLYRKDLVSEFRKFKKDLIINLDTGLACWFLGLIIMVCMNLLLVYVFKSNGATNENEVQKLISAFPLVMALDVCLLAPFNEEVVFRKAIYDVFKNKYIFIILSFLIFGGAHVLGSAKTLVDYLYIIPYGALGGMFAIAYSKTDTVFTSMTFHIFHNTILFLISVLI